MASGDYRPAGLRRTPEWARLPAGCCFRVQNLRDGIPEPSVILPLSVESSPLAAEPSMKCVPSVEGSLLRREPSMISTSSMEGSVVLNRTIHDICLQRGGFASET